MSSTGFHPMGVGSAVLAPTTLGASDPLLTRTHYFDGRLLTAEDLVRDQLYLEQRLREVGRVLGHGVAEGLELTVDLMRQRIVIGPGLALTPDGRALSLTRGRSITLDLGDRAELARLNRGRHTRLADGLYALALTIDEATAGLSETFPTDLGVARTLQPDRIIESVRALLLPLPVALSPDRATAARAALAPRLVAAVAEPLLASLLGADAVALGVVAVRDNRIGWVDGDLLRRPRRSDRADGAWQRDLARHYARLLADLLADRRARGQDGRIAAVEHLPLLPPAGPLPKDAIDPVGGAQVFFPERWDVRISVVRSLDAEALIEEAMTLAPLDPAKDDAIAILVLARLSDDDHAALAPRLTRAPSGAATTRELARFDAMSLRLRPLPPVHALDTDADVWRAVWERIGDGDLLYVRRSLRAIETGASALVLASGYAAPAPLPQRPGQPTPPPPPPPPVGGGGRPPLDDLIDRLRDRDLVLRRPVVGDADLEAVRAIRDRVGDNARAIGLVQDLERVLPSDTPGFWPLAAEALKRGDAPALVRELDRPEVATSGADLVKLLKRRGFASEVIDRVDIVRTRIPR